MNKHYTHAPVNRTTCTYKYPHMHAHTPQRTHKDIQTRVLARRHVSKTVWRVEEGPKPGGKIGMLPQSTLRRTTEASLFPRATLLWVTE